MQQGSGRSAASYMWAALHRTFEAQGISEATHHWTIFSIIGASRSKPHTNGTALPAIYVYMYGIYGCYVHNVCEIYA